MCLISRMSNQENVFEAVGSGLGAQLGRGLRQPYISLPGKPRWLLHICAEHPDLCALKMLNAIREFCEGNGDDSTLKLILEAAKMRMGYRDVATTLDS